MQLRVIIGTIMRGLLIIACISVYSVQAWNQDFPSIHVVTQTGQVPPKYNPMTKDDNQATRKANSFIGFMKIVPQLNPLQLPSLGPYNIALNDAKFRGDLTLGNLVLNGIKHLHVPALELRMNPARVDFNVTFPNVNIDVDFMLKGAITRENLDTQGHVRASIDNLLVSAALAPKIALVGPSKVIQLDGAVVAISLGNLQLSMDMNHHSEEFKAILTDFLHNIYNYSNIVDDLLRVVLRAINKELTQVQAKEIVQYLIAPSRSAPSRSG